MKVSSLSLIVLTVVALVSANERGRQNDWHKVHKPEKFKPDAPRNEGKVLREERESSTESEKLSETEHPETEKVSCTVYLIYRRKSPSLMIKVRTCLDMPLLLPLLKNLLLKPQAP